MQITSARTTSARTTSARTTSARTTSARTTSARTTSAQSTTAPIRRAHCRGLERLREVLSDGYLRAQEPRGIAAGHDPTSWLRLAPSQTSMASCVLSDEIETKKSHVKVSCFSTSVFCGVYCARFRVEQLVVQEGKGLECAPCVSDLPCRAWLGVQCVTWRPVRGLASSA